MRFRLITAFFLVIVSGGWFPHGSGTLPNVPGYDVFPIIYQSNNYSGRDYDYVWSTYDHSGTPGVYSLGTDSNWGPKLFQYGWIQLPRVISTCTVPNCLPDFAGQSSVDPLSAELITMMRDNYIPNKLQSNRTGVLVVPCAVGGTGYTTTSPGSVRTSSSAGIGTDTITLPNTWGFVAGSSVSDTTASAAIPVGTTVIAVTASTIQLSTNIVSPGVGSNDALTFTNPVGDWQVGGRLYESCLARTNEVMALDPNNRLKAVFGNGGEADSGTGISQALYTSYTQAMVADFRSRATGATNVPFLFGGMVPAWVTMTGLPATRIEAAIAAMPSNVTNSAFVDPVGLSAPTQAYTPQYKVNSITIPSNPCALVIQSQDQIYTLVNGATDRFANIGGTTEANGSWVTTVVSQNLGTGIANVTIPVNCTHAYTSGGNAYPLQGVVTSGIHFSAESEREMGNRYYTALVPFL